MGENLLLLLIGAVRIQDQNLPRVPVDVKSRVNEMVPGVKVGALT
jgi:hypothetical protein